MKTVKALREALANLDDDAIVVLEGCDCVGDWDGTIDPAHKDYGKRKTILLNRNDFDTIGEKP